MSVQPNQMGPVPAAGAAPLLVVRNVEVMYDEVILVLRGLSLEVPQGAVVEAEQVLG